MGDNCKVCHWQQLDSWVITIKSYFQWLTLESWYTNFMHTINNLFYDLRLDILLYYWYLMGIKFCQFEQARAVLTWVIRICFGFALLRVVIGLKKLVQLSQPIKRKTQTNRDSLVNVFPRFSPATCIYFEFWLVHWNVCLLCDWPEWLLWFWK